MPTLDEVIAGLEEVANRKRFRRIDFVELLDKQKIFVACGAAFPERMLLGGNQTGKTTTGATEAVYHMTGLYPKGWKGKVFDHPTEGWLCGSTAKDVRDKPQEILCGKPGVLAAFGTGLIPKDMFVTRPNASPDISLARGVTDAYDTIQVKHYTNGIYDGISIARFKSYDQGRKAFQSGTLDWIWCDEEPPMDVYGEMLPRLLAHEGILWITLTPMEGQTELVNRFYVEKPAGTKLMIVDLDDCTFYTTEQKAKMVARYPINMRAARKSGIPMLGSGAVFNVPEELIMEPPISNLPFEWKKLWGLDFGIDHPFAAVHAAYDPEADCIHITHALKLGKSISGQEQDGWPIIHAAAMKKIAASSPVAWPHDGHQRDKGSGKQLSLTYKEAGLRMLGEHAQFATGGYSTEAAIADMEARMLTGRFKVASHLSEWFAEYRSYHRKENQIVHYNDDLMSATQKIIMEKRHAQSGSMGSQIRREGGSYMAIGHNDNVLDWGTGKDYDQS